MTGFGGNGEYWLKIKYGFPYNFSQLSPLIQTADSGLRRVGGTELPPHGGRGRLGSSYKNTVVYHVYKDPLNDGVLMATIHDTIKENRNGLFL
jgi:hypothetical protein